MRGIGAVPGAGSGKRTKLSPNNKKLQKITKIPLPTEPVTTFAIPRPVSARPRTKTMIAMIIILGGRGGLASRTAVGGGGGWNS